ncbi:B3 domain-containing transcription factor VRN1-like [Rosa rugosa]|uniref:B3 domain-containing transcription factor VRN1-like n=1 Tax=Rosa rugosa TaxID=74645 RepID=UPI002B410749|nr:B3 domain-containing transcription factor VRN1-like [Rosa rugosa]
MYSDKYTCLGDFVIGKNKMSKTSVQVTERPSSSLTAPLDNHHEAANNFVSENPFFKVTLGSSHMEKSVVHVPASFAWSFIRRKKQKVMLQVTDRLWPVDLIAFKPSLASFSSGWATFVEEYSLRVGDVCIFELMEMNDDIILQCHWRVPRSYVKKYEKKYGEELSNIVHLKLPCGTEWEIEVTRHNGVFWFDKGWETFSKFYSIESRYSLVFQYEGNSRFKVNIFDRTNSEIEYPIKTPKKEENDVDDQFPPVSHLLPQKNNIASSNGDKKDLPAEVDEGDKYSSTQRSQKPTTEVLGRMHPSTTRGSGAVQTVKEFKYTEQPSCFLVPMCPSYIEKHMLWLPSDFAMHLKHLITNSGNLTLHVSEGSTTRTWTVGMKYEKERAKFQSGWSEFVQGNKLNHGDVCDLMLIDKNELLFEVKIFRAREAVDCTFSPGKLFANI